VGARSSASEDFLAGKIERPSQGAPDPCGDNAPVTLLQAGLLLIFTLVI
jgi:hypothetical protein